MVENKPDAVENALEIAKPLAAQLSFGAVMGYCSGMAMKKIGKAVAFGVGVVFIGVQAAASTGYIAVDWVKIKDDTMKKMDKVRGFVVLQLCYSHLKTRWQFVLFFAACTCTVNQY